MAHVVAEPCIGCKHGDCTVVCPVDCFRDGARMLYIHPGECIDCAACVPECPRKAIFREDGLPEDWVPYRDLNATMARQSKRVNREDYRTTQPLATATALLKPFEELIRNSLGYFTNREPSGG